MFYTPRMRVEYREEPCRSALNRVKGMPFEWSLNPYMGCVHRCTFCYVRAFELRADRPADDRYGRSIRVKVNVAEVLARELARPSWSGEHVAIGAATDPYQPAEGRYRLTRACLEVLGRAATPFSIITRGPMIVRDVDVLADAAQTSEGLGHVLGPDARRGGLADDRAGHGASAPAAAGALARSSTPASRRASAWRRSSPASPTGPSSSPRSCEQRAQRARRASGRTCSTCKPGTREHFLEALARDWPEELERYERLYARRRATSRTPRREPVRTPSRASSRASTASATAGSVQLAPPPEPVQLALHV